MRVVAALTGFGLLAGCFQDIFEAVLLPRRIDRRWRFMYAFYRSGWGAWRLYSKRFSDPVKRESAIAIFGPLSMILLFLVWGLSLICGFALLQWALPFPASPRITLGRQFDLSANAFFTLGLEDSASRSQFSLALTFLEAGTGFGFIALMVSYLPVLYTHFAQRDARLVQLHARAGTPATAGTALRRYAVLGGSADLILWLAEWERWAADLVETHSAYPMLAFYRSQHANQSWLATLAVILDLTAFLIGEGADELLLPASAAFTACRRVLVEICVSLGLEPPQRASDRISAKNRISLRDSLMTVGWIRAERPLDPAIFDALIASYAPRLLVLSRYLLLTMPAFLPPHEETDADRSSERSRLAARLLQE